VVDFVVLDSAFCYICTHKNIYVSTLLCSWFCVGAACVWPSFYVAF
jgi:hypothetical protein